MIHYNPQFSGSVTGTEAVVSLSGSFTGSGTIENAQTASKLKASASFGLGMESFNFDGSTNQVISIDTASIHFISGAMAAVGGTTASLLITASISGLTQSFTKGDGSTFELNLPDTASVDLLYSMSNGLGIDPFVFENVADAIVQIDTSSAHFITGSVKAISDSTGSLLTTASISGLTQSFTKADGSTFEINLPDTASTDLLYSMSNGLGIETFTFENIANASVQVDTASYHIANLTSSVLISAETSSIRPIDTIVFTQGDSSSFSITQDTSSFVKSVNGILPDPTTGNANTSLTAVSTGTSASMLAASSSGNLDNGEVWIIAGQTGGDPVSGSGSNGESYIFDSGSGQLYKLANTDQAENDVRYVIKSGDTMTGNLILNADPTLALQATTKQYVDPSFVTASVSTGSVGEQVLTFTRLGGGTDVITLFSSSFTQTASFANKVSQSLTQGKGVETFSYNGSTVQTVQVDTASFHVANLTASLVTTASISGLTQSFTKGDGSTFEINLPDTGAVDLAFEITGGLGVEPFTFDNTADATVQVDTASFHVANLTASLLLTASNGLYTMSFTKGDGSTFAVPLSASEHAITASYVVNQTYKENVTGANTYTITHNLGEQYPIVQSYDTATNVMVIPSEVTASSANALDIKFASAFTGIVVVQR